MLFDSFYDWLLFYGYYIGQLLIILSFFLLALRTRKILIYITLIGFVLFFIGNIIPLLSVRLPTRNNVSRRLLLFSGAAILDRRCKCCCRIASCGLRGHV